MARPDTSHEPTSSAHALLDAVADDPFAALGEVEGVTEAAELGETPLACAYGLEPIAGWTPPTTARPEAASRAQRAPDPSFLLEPEPAFAPEVLVGFDDRVRIHETTGFPWRTICALRIITREGEEFSGTGWLIGPRTVITAGHCVHHPALGGWVDRVEVVPARNGNDRPFSTVVSSDFRSVRGWTEELERQFDYGAILLPPGQGLGELGHLGYAVYTEASLTGTYLNIAGYPIDKPEGTLWWAARASTRVRRGTITYELDTAGGQSGAPVWRVDAKGRRLVVGIHTNGKAQGNSATMITREVFANLGRWAAEGREEAAPPPRPAS